MALRSHGICPRWRPLRDKPLHRRKKWRHARGRAYLRDPRICAVQDALADGGGKGVLHPREQRHAIHRDRGRLHDRSAHIEPCRIDVDDGKNHPVVADDPLERRGVLAGCPGGVPAETTVHQRRPAALPRGARVRRGARHVVFRWQRGRGIVQGARAGARGHGRGNVSVFNKRGMDALDPVQAARTRQGAGLGKPAGFARETGRVLLHARSKIRLVGATHPGHRSAGAGLAPWVRSGNGGRGRAHGPAHLGGCARGLIAKLCRARPPGLPRKMGAL